MKSQIMYHGYERQTCWGACGMECKLHASWRYKSISKGGGVAHISRAAH